MATAVRRQVGGVLSVRVPRDLLVAADELASSRGTSVSEVVREAIELYFRVSVSMPGHRTFEIVAPGEVPTRTGRPGLAAPWALAVAEGHTIFMPGSLPGAFSKRSYLRTRGFQPAVRRAVRNGVSGYYVWATRE